MKNKFASLLFTAVISLFISCSDLQLPVSDLQSSSFWAYDTAAGRYYPINARMLAEGTHCKIWVEDKSGIDTAAAREIADTFDDDIYQKMIDSFGVSFDIAGAGRKNTMELADYYGNGDGKLCILFLDIRDGYYPEVNDSFVAGYFLDGNLYDKNTNPVSNENDMLYIDTYPGEPGSSGSNKTIAHEMQHLMNYVTGIVKRPGGKTGYMDTWIDEGLSSAAEWVYSGEYTFDRVEWFNKAETQKSYISRGNNFYVWGNHTTNQNPYPVLDDYATVYLFFQWLRLQSSDSNIYRKIITSEYYDYRAVTTNMTGAGGNYGNWDYLLRDWFAANFINADSGPYGYKGELDVQAKTIPPELQNHQNASLAPGEGVYSVFRTADMPLSVAGNIRYTSIGEDGIGNSAAVDNILLTFNINTDRLASSENGTITGYAADVDTTAGFSRSLSRRPDLAGPFPISASDALVQNRAGNMFTADDVE